MPEILPIVSRVARSVRKLAQKHSPSMNAALLMAMRATPVATFPGPTKASAAVAPAQVIAEAMRKRFLRPA